MSAGLGKKAMEKKKLHPERDAIQPLIASINTVSLRPLFLHESFLCRNYSVHAFEMTLLKWQESPSTLTSTE